MKFGDKEWFKKLEEIYPFPMYVAFYIANDGSTQSRVIETSASSIGNVAYRKIKPTRFLDGTRAQTALVNVKYCQTTQDYYNEVVRIKEAWNLK